MLIMMMGIQVLDFWVKFLYFWVIFRISWRIFLYFSAISFEFLGEGFFGFLCDICWISLWFFVRWNLLDFLVIFFYFLVNFWISNYPQANALSNHCMARRARRTKSSRLKAGGPSRGPSGGLSGVRQEKDLSIEKSSQMWSTFPWDVIEKREKWE